MAGTDFLYIPPTIRQEYMPFRNPDGKYSFKPQVVGQGKQIFPFPATLPSFFLNDSSLPVKDYDTFLNLIPSVQIREYQPDARLTQTLKWFSYFKKGIDTAMQNLDGNGTAEATAKVKEAAMAGLEKLQSKIGDFTSGKASLLDSFGGFADYTDIFGANDGAVLAVPWILYYQLNTTTTTNVYEIPVNWKDKDLFISDGTYGWKNDSSSASLAELIGMKNGEGALAKLLNGMGLQEIKINKMPVFNPEGDNGSTETIQLNFVLVNDTVQAAINNFIFCHNLFGNNRWLQYGFVQASAALYDISLPGANRYWMCQGKFHGKPKGTLRVPSAAVKNGIISTATAPAYTGEQMASLQSEDVALQEQMAADLGQAEMELAQAEFNAGRAEAEGRSQEEIDGAKGQMIEAQNKRDNIKQQAMAKNAEYARRSAFMASDNANRANGGGSGMAERIKIPDAYEITLDFTPLLPDNFNNFLYGWRASNDWDIMKGGMTKPGKERPWVYEKVVEEISKAFS